ncbi:hypothetical protein KPL74_04790 [Bacillus sp. NP157]|nr:hypothetical protein KPL74_04790 [Bacillus sp. NP157]
MRMLVVLAGIAIGASTFSVGATPPDLAPLAAQLKTIQQTHGVNEERDAGPEFTPVKQALLRWVEAQLPPSRVTDGPDGTARLLEPAEFSALGARLNQALDAAGLTCNAAGTTNDRCRGDSAARETERGYLGEISVAGLDDDRYLLVITGVGMACGYDESAYLYEQGPDEHWRLLLSIEQDNYGKDDYRPQNFLAIQVSPSNTAWDEPSPPPRVVALGYHPWCWSNWQSISTRLWRTSRSTATPAPLIDREDETLYMGDDFIAAASLGDNDLLVQFAGDSIDGVALVRQHVLHYRLGPKDAVKRIAPVALSPQTFVEEWLAEPWNEASRWLSASADSRRLGKLHASLNRGHLFGEFDEAPTRCNKSGSLWQVAFSRDVGDRTEMDYFKVDWQAPYDFRLVAASHERFAGCDVKATIDPASGSLFHSQGWTR